MKLSNFKIKLLRTFTAAFAVASFWSCSDKVDSSNLFVFEGETVANYLEDTEGYSMFSQLTKRHSFCPERQSRSAVHRLRVRKKQLQY